HPSLSDISTLSLHDALPIFHAFGDAFELALELEQRLEARLGSCRHLPPLGQRRRALAHARGERLDAGCDLGDRALGLLALDLQIDRKSTRLNSSHVSISYAV